MHVAPFAQPIQLTIRPPRHPGAQQRGTGGDLAERSLGGWTWRALRSAGSACAAAGAVVWTGSPGGLTGRSGRDTRGAHQEYRQEQRKRFTPQTWQHSVAPGALRERGLCMRVACPIGWPSAQHAKCHVGGTERVGVQGGIRFDTPRHRGILHHSSFMCVACLLCLGTGLWCLSFWRVIP